MAPWPPPPPPFSVLVGIKLDSGEAGILKSPRNQIDGHFLRYAVETYVLSGMTWLWFLPPYLPNYPTIGHSENSPCPNLKKLGEPASTTAIMAIFFPCFITAIGWGRLPGVAFTGCWVIRLWNDNQGNHGVEVSGVGAIVTRSPVSGALSWAPFSVTFSRDLSPPFFVGSFCRTRGMGGGISGSASKSAVNSTKDGIRVVLALSELSEHKGNACARGLLYLTTEMAKSGIGGLVFLYGVFGLYTLKKWAYGESSANAGCAFAFKGIPCPWGMKRSARKMEPVGTIRIAQTSTISDQRWFVFIPSNGIILIGVLQPKAGVNNVMMRESMDLIGLRTICMRGFR